MGASKGDIIGFATLLLLSLSLGLVPWFGATQANRHLPDSLSASTSLQSVNALQTTTQSPSGVLFDHLVVVMLENQGVLDICGGNPPPCNGEFSPYMSGLANNYSVAQQYLSLVKTSWPDYYGILGAFVPPNCSSNNPGPCYPPPGSLTNPNLVDRFEAAGVTWRAYMESQTSPAGCVTTNDEPYIYIHNGFVAFTDITNSTGPSGRCSKIVLANPDTCGPVTDCALINDLNSQSAPNFMWLTPNDCNNMRSTSVCTNGCTDYQYEICIQEGDSYLSTLVPSILNSYTFQNSRSALFVTFDEGNGYCPLINSSSEDCLYAVWAGPVAKTNFSSSQLYSHYSLTKTIEVNWNLATLTSNDASATPMTEFFKPDFTISASSPAPVVVGRVANSSIAISPLNGWTGIVSLSDTVPPGLSCGAISPSTITGAGSATVSCSAAVPGNYTLTVTGTNGSLSHSASTTFRIQDFTITAASSQANINTNAISTVMIGALNHFNGTVALAGSPPAGLTCGPLTPSSVAGGHGNATISCTSTVAGNYSLAVTGTIGPLTHDAAAVFQFQDFAITASQPPPIGLGDRVTVNLTITGVNGFVGIVSFAYNAPSGLACGSFYPSTISGSGVATLTCRGGYAYANYTLSVTGTSGTLSHTVQVVVTVQSGSVGGVVIPVDRLAVLLQFLPAVGLILVLVATGIVAARSWKSRMDRPEAGSGDNNQREAQY